jgi:hypothetical protein
MLNYLKRNNLMWGRKIIDPALFLMLIFGEKKKPRAVRFSIHWFPTPIFIFLISSKWPSSVLRSALTRSRKMLPL